MKRRIARPCWWPGWENFCVLFETQKVVLGKFEIKTLTDQTLKAIAWGEPFQWEKHRFKQAVKAVTYHQLRIWETSKGWRARVILDV